MEFGASSLSITTKSHLTISVRGGQWCLVLLYPFLSSSLLPFSPLSSSSLSLFSPLSLSLFLSLSLPLFLSYSLPSPMFFSIKAKFPFFLLLLNISHTLCFSWGLQPSTQPGSGLSMLFLLVPLVYLKVFFLFFFIIIYYI